MYPLIIPPELYRSDAEVEARRGTMPNRADYEFPLDEDSIVITPDGVVARLVTNCLSEKVVKEAAASFKSVHGSLTNRGSVIYKDSLMERERKTDGTLSFTKEVPPSVLQLLAEENARLGLSAPHGDYLGYVDKTPREPFCRETAWSQLVREVEYVYRHELPDFWQRQYEFMRTVSPDFKYNESVYSTDDGEQKSANLLSHRRRRFPGWYGEPYC